MSRFEKILKEQYLKLDIKPIPLTEIQQNVVDKMVSSGKAKYDGQKKGCAIISYDVDGEKGKFKINPAGKVEKYQEEEDQEEFAGISRLTGGALTANDLRIAKTLAGGTAKGGLLFNRNPEKRIQKALGTVTGKLAQKLEKLAAGIRV